MIEYLVLALWTYGAFVTSDAMSSYVAANIADDEDDEFVELSESQALFWPIMLWCIWPLLAYELRKLS